MIHRSRGVSRHASAPWCSAVLAARGVGRVALWPRSARCLVGLVIMAQTSRRMDRTTCGTRLVRYARLSVRRPSRVASTKLELRFGYSRNFFRYAYDSSEGTTYERRVQVIVTSIAQTPPNL